MIEKRLVGTQNIDGINNSYYLLKKGIFFGIGIDTDTNIGGEYYFTEDENIALDLCTKVYKGTVTATTLSYIIDDIIA